MSYPIRLPSDGPLVTVTHPTPIIWLLELHNGLDNRLTETLLAKALLPALDAVERAWRESWRAAQSAKDPEGGRGALIIVGNRAQNRFFSNGLDYDNTMNTPYSTTNFIPLVFCPVMRRLLTFPIPTIAALNGHVFAAALILSLCCDYRIMTDGSIRRAWMCMNEIHFGAAIPVAFTAVIRAKVSDTRAQQAITLEGRRFSPQEAHEVGLIDDIVKGDTEAVVARAQEVAEGKAAFARSGAYGVIKRELYRDVWEAGLRDLILPSVGADDAAAKARL